jgi:hypothetical protein
MIHSFPEGEFSEGFWYVYVWDKTEILDILLMQYGDELVGGPTYYLHYYQKDRLDIPSRHALILGEELKSVKEVESRKNFDRWLTIEERHEFSKRFYRSMGYNV